MVNSFHHLLPLAPRRRTKFGVTPVAVRIPRVVRCASRVLEIDDEKRREVVDLQRRLVYLRLDFHARAGPGKAVCSPADRLYEESIGMLCGYHTINSGAAK